VCIAFYFFHDHGSTTFELLVSLYKLISDDIDPWIATRRQLRTTNRITAPA